MAEPIKFIAPNGDELILQSDQKLTIAVGDNEFTYPVQFLHDFCQKNEAADIPLLIEALKKEFPNIQSKVDLLQTGVTLRNETVELLTGTDDTTDKAAAREANLKNAKVKMDIYEDLTKVNDTLSAQIQNIGGAANTAEGEATAERSTAQNMLKANHQKTKQT